MNAEAYIRKQIQKILSEGETPEQKEKPKAKPKPAKLGRLNKPKFGRGGAMSKYAKGSQARVETDPAGLLSDLGAQIGAGKNDAQKILGLVRSAIYGTDVMSAAYAGATLVTQQDGTPTIEVAAKVIKPRDAVYFMSHVLTAADTTGQLDFLTTSVTVHLGGGGLYITFEEP